MRRRIFLFVMPIVLAACFFVLGGTAEAAVGDFILSGGPNSTDNFCVDDDIYVYLNGNLMVA